MAEADFFVLQDEVLLRPRTQHLLSVLQRTEIFQPGITINAFGELDAEMLSRRPGRNHVHLDFLIHPIVADGPEVVSLEGAIKRRQPEIGKDQINIEKPVWVAPGINALGEIVSIEKAQILAL